MLPAKCQFVPAWTRHRCIAVLAWCVLVFASACADEGAGSANAAIAANTSCEALSGIAETRLHDDDVLASMRACEVDADCEALRPVFACAAPHIRVPSCGSAISTSAHQAEVRVRAIERQFCDDASHTAECLVGANCPSTRPVCNVTHQCELRLPEAS